MDWFSWLSKTGLEPSLVYEYGLSFSHNELEEEDIVYLDHEFLQSMGISIAKHRLEILKLAGKTKGNQTSGWRPVVRRLMSAIKRTKRSKWWREKRRLFLLLIKGVNGKVAQCGRERRGWGWVQKGGCCSPMGLIFHQSQWC
ncbi:hypothetical protein ERO13_D05G122750v2 [Gossypium hirsutum]|nr:hypothetical protein ERO13_D05G122750v2 [Gossypium hirsutum]